VRFRYRDSKNPKSGDRQQTMKINASEFVRRFLLHVLPRGFVRLRHFGLLANTHRRIKLERCRELLGDREPQQVAVTPAQGDEPPSANESTSSCPACEAGTMARTDIVILRMPRDGPRVKPIGIDSS